MLHTISRSFCQVDRETLLTMIAPADAVLLLQDGVSAAVAQTNTLRQLRQATTLIYVLREDVEARGLSTLMDRNVQLIGYGEFVELSVRFSPQIAW